MDGIVFTNLKFKLIKISISRKWRFYECKFEKTRKLGNYWVMSFPLKIKKIAKEDIFLFPLKMEYGE